MLQIVSTLISKKEYANKMLLYAENHNQVTHPFLISWRSVWFVFQVSLWSNFFLSCCQSISGRRSFAEALFGEIDEHSENYKESLLRGSSLHKVWF